MVMLKTWEEGKAETRAETQATAVLTVLRVRGIAVPEVARERILAQRDLEQLERWHESSAFVALPCSRPHASASWARRICRGWSVGLKKPVSLHRSER